MVAACVSGSDGLVQHSVEALDEDGGIFQRHTLEQKGLVEEEPRGVFDLAVAGIGEQLSDDLVIGVDLECGLQLGQILLAHGLHHLAHTS